MIQFGVTEIVFIGTSVLGFMAMREFIKTVNGQLRIIMIWFFATIGFTYLMAGVNFALYFLKLSTIPQFALRMLFGVPKLFIMGWLVWYLKHYNRNAT